MSKAKLGQEVLVRGVVKEITNTKSGIIYKVMPYDEKNNDFSIWTMWIKESNIEVCRHCDYKGELICADCEAKIAHYHEG